MITDLLQSPGKIGYQISPKEILSLVDIDRAPAVDVDRKNRSAE